MPTSKKVIYYSGTPTAERMFYGSNELRTIPDGAILSRSGNLNVNGAFGKSNPITADDVGFTFMNTPVMKADGVSAANVNIDKSLENRMTNTLGDSELFREVKAMGLSAVEVIPRATKSAPGIVIIGNNIDVNNTGTISVKTGSKDVLGLLRVGNGINVSNGLISLPIASKSILGGVVVGDNINVDTTGKISLQKASTSAHGIVKVGSNISVSGDSVISVPVATSGTLGVVRTGTNITNSSGVISVPTATNTTLGVVKAGANITISGDGSINAANSYVHPSTHPGSMITQDASHRFVSDSEKNKWNGMLPLTGGTMTGTITGKNASGAWIGGKTNACMMTTVGASSYASGITFTSTTHTFSVGSLGNGQCGIYMYNNGTTENQTDGKLYLDTNGNAFCGGQFTATGDIIGMSDKRLKRNVEPIVEALDKVKRLNGVNFIWRKDGKKSLGLIAQEVQEVVPEAVTFNKDNKSYGVKYGNMVGLLIEAIKELNDRIVALEKR